MASYFHCPVSAQALPVPHRGHGRERGRQRGADRSLDALTSDRRARLAAASHQLPVLYVAVLVLTGMALIVNATVLTLRGG